MVYENCPMLPFHRLVYSYFHSPTEDTMNLRPLIPHAKCYRIHSRAGLFELTHLTSTFTNTHTQPAPQATSSAYGATGLTAIPALGLKLHGEKNRKRMNFMRATESSTSLPVGWPSIENANTEPQF